MTIVVLKHASKAFGATTVLKDVNLATREGEFLVLVGPSGCGKSTLLRAIAGLEDLDSGDIVIDGRIANDLSPSERGIAMVFQSYALYPHMTVAQNMAFALRLAKRPRAEIAAAVAGAAETLGIAHLLDRRPAALSGGQRQRVAIGRAIVRQPRLFLFDEPLSNLDAALRVRMRYEFAALHRTLGTTMIYVTHDQAEALTLADRIVVLNAGAIAQIGRPMDLYHAPADIFVAGFIGSPRMNFLPGTLVSAGSDAIVEVDGVPITAAVDARGGRPGDAVTIGVRPERIELGGEVGAGANALPARIRFVEVLGNTTYIHLDRDGAGDPLIVQAQGERADAIGSQVTATLPAGHLHVFASDGSAFPRNPSKRLEDAA